MKLKEFESAVVAAIKEGNYRVGSSNSDRANLYVKLDATDEEVFCSVYKDGRVNAYVGTDTVDGMFDVFKKVRIECLTKDSGTKKTELDAIENEIKELNEKTSE